jgi:hypothetical protein
VKESEGINGNKICKDNAYELFKEMIHFYFVEGFDMLDTLIDIRTGTMMKYRDYKSRAGPDLYPDEKSKLLSQIKNSFFPIIDPFDLNYCPSRNFSWK